MVNVFGLSFYSSDKTAFLAELDEELGKRKKAGVVAPYVVFTPNPEQVVLAKQQPAFFKMLKKADTLLPDGIGIVQASQFFSLAGKLRGKSSEKVTERIAGVQVVQDLLQRYQDEVVLLVGGKGYHQDKSTKEDFARLSIQNREVVWFTGYQAVGQASVEDECKLRSVIRAVKPTIVFVAFGAPEQEAWIIDHKGLLQQEGVKMVMAVGGSFDVLTGKLKRAPSSWQKFGFEWLFRLIQEPSRWKRQLRLFSFMGMTLKESLKILFT